MIPTTFSDIVSIILSSLPLLEPPDFPMLPYRSLCPGALLSIASPLAAVPLYFPGSAVTQGCAFPSEGLELEASEEQEHTMCFFRDSC